MRLERSLFHMIKMALSHDKMRPITAIASASPCWMPTHRHRYESSPSSKSQRCASDCRGPVEPKKCRRRRASKEFTERPLAAPNRGCVRSPRSNGGPIWPTGGGEPGSPAEPWTTTELWTAPRVTDRNLRCSSDPHRTWCHHSMDCQGRRTRRRTSTHQDRRRTRRSSPRTSWYIRIRVGLSRSRSHNDNTLTSQRYRSCIPMDLCTWAALRNRVGLVVRRPRTGTQRRPQYSYCRHCTPYRNTARRPRRKPNTRLRCTRGQC
jgi:hypothetical protein